MGRVSEPLDLDALESIAKAAIDKGNRLQQVATVTMQPHTLLALIEQARRLEEALREIDENLRLRSGRRGPDAHYLDRAHAVVLAALGEQTPDA